MQPSHHFLFSLYIIKSICSQLSPFLLVPIFSASPPRSFLSFFLFLFCEQGKSRRLQGFPHKQPNVVFRVFIFGFSWGTTYLREKPNSLKPGAFSLGIIAASTWIKNRKDFFLGGGGIEHWQALPKGIAISKLWQNRKDHCSLSLCLLFKSSCLSPRCFLYHCNISQQFTQKHRVILETKLFLIANFKMSLLFHSRLPLQHLSVNHLLADDPSLSSLLESPRFSSRFSFCWSSWQLL